MRSRDVAVVAVFSATIVASDFALVGFANIKLMDTVVILVALVFGFKKGADVAVV